MRAYVGFAGIATMALVIGLAAIPAELVGQAKADSSPSSTLYVDGASASCSNTGSGTQAVPFCTIQAAANVVNPGQTVYVVSDSGVQYGPTVITRSGTPGAPITILGRTTGIRTQLTGAAAPGVLTINNAQYVTVDSLVFYNYSGTSAIAVEGSQHVTLNNLQVLGQTNLKMPADNILVDGGSSDVTVSRTQITGLLGTGVHVEPGASQVTVTTNAIYLDNGTDVSIDGARSAAVTSNGLEVGNCGTGISVTGLPSSASVVAENNVLATCDSAPSVSVDAASTPAVRTDYNAFYEGNPASGSPYSWDGVTYSSAAAFAQATGHGSHDLDMATTGTPFAGRPAAGSPVIDSADCAAPGELSTDINGAPRVRDPLVTDTGNGTCNADRGAYELQDQLPITTTSTPLDSAGYQAGPVPYAFGLTVTSSATSGWREPVSYTVDFGDGSPAVLAAPGTEANHTYATPGTYTVTVTAADTSGSSRSRTFTVYAAPDSPLPLAFTGSPDGLGTRAGIWPDTADFAVSAGSLTAQITKASAAFGDGQSAAATRPGADGPWSWQHIYVYPGTYTATVTVTDVLGRTSTAKTTVTVGDELQPQAPRPDYAHSVAAHGTVKLFIGSLYSGSYSQADGEVLNVKVLSPATAGSLIVYPDGTPRPGRAAVVFQAGKPAENFVLATSPGDGYVDLYNSSAGPITLRVVTVATEDVETQYGGEQGATYSPVTPAQVLPRTKLAAGHQVPVPVGGIDGVPAGAQDVVLDITSSGSTAPGEIDTGDPYNGASGQVGSAYWATGRQVTGLATVPVRGGRALLINSSKGSAYFTASVVGYYVPGGNQAVFLPAVASRLLQVTLAGKSSARIRVTGKDGVPSSGITAAMLNLTAIGATAASTVTAYADGTPRPAASSLSYEPGVTVATAGIVGVGSDGAIDIYNNGTKPVTITVDLSGSYYSYS